MSLSGVPRSTRGIIARPRITALLDEDAQVVVLHAPSGYGKSVALAQWAESTPETGVWLRLPEGTQSAVGFVEVAATELWERGVVGADHPFSQAGAALTFVADPWAYLRSGIESLGTPVTLAVDEAHVLDDETIAGLLGVLKRTPLLRLRLATRRSSAITEPSIGLDLDAAHVTADDLALSREEALGILGPHADATMLDQIDSEGGAAALARLIVLGAERTSSSTWSVAEAADSLLRLRRGTWQSDFVDFLEMAALPDSIDAEFASELTERRDAATLLERAEAEGVGIWTYPADEHHRRFVFASFLREALERDLRRRLPSSQTRALDLRIAQWDLDNARAWPALDRAVRNADWNLASEVVRRHWNELLKLGPQLRILFEKVPPLALTRQPLIAVLLAIVYNARQSGRFRAVEYFLLAAYGARTTRNSAAPADRALLAAVETAAMRVSGRSRATATSARAAFELMSSMDVRERDRLGINEPTAWNQVGTSLFYTGDTGRAVECFRRSTAVSDAKGLTGGLQGLALAAGALAMDGDMPEAHAIAVEAEGRRWPDGWIDGYAGSMYQLARSLTALEAGDVDAAEARLRLLDPHRPTIEHWALLAHVDALIGLYRHDPHGAALRLEAEIRAQRARHAFLRVTDVRVQHTLALVQLAGGDAAAAEDVLSKTPTDPRLAVSRGRIDLAREDPDRALRHLRSADISTASARVRTEAAALTAAALALADPSAAAARSAVARVDALLRDRAQQIPLSLVPAPGLAALARVAQTDAGLSRFASALEAAQAAALLPRADAAPRLTPRERAVARELVRTDSVAAIAESLNVSPNTVKSQLRALYRKLGVNSRAQALRSLSSFDTRGDRGR